MTNSSATIYRERLWPAPWLIISTALVIPASLLVFLPINQTVGIIVAIVLYLAIVAMLVFSTPAIEVTETEFVAGKARLPLALVGAVTAWSGDEGRLERGQNLDARAWLLIRGWIDPVVRIEVTDASDPVPYWLVSTRHPEAVLDALQKTKPRTPGR